MPSRVDGELLDPHAIFEVADAHKIRVDRVENGGGVFVSFTVDTDPHTVRMTELRNLAHKLEAATLRRWRLGIPAA